MSSDLKKIRKRKNNKYHQEKLIKTKIKSLQVKVIRKGEVVSLKEVR